MTEVEACSPLALIPYQYSYMSQARADLVSGSTHGTAHCDSTLSALLEPTAMRGWSETSLWPVHGKKYALYPPDSGSKKQQIDIA